MIDDSGSPSSTSPGGVTILHAGVEEMDPNYWVLSVFDLIGCYSSGPTEGDAIAEADRRVRQYFEWIGKKGGESAPFEESIQVKIAERFQRSPWPKDPSRYIRAYYGDDARPLRAWDLDIALRLLDWSREDLLQLADSLLPDFLQRLQNEPRWRTLDSLLGHIWESENAILGTMGAAVDIITMPSEVWAGSRRSGEGCDRSCSDGPRWKSSGKFWVRNGLPARFSAARCGTSGIMF